MCAPTPGALFLDLVQDPFMQSLHREREYIYLIGVAASRHENFKERFF